MTIVAVLLAVMIGLAALVVAISFLVGALSVLWIGTRVIFARALDWGILGILAFSAAWVCLPLVMLLASFIVGYMIVPANKEGDMEGEVNQLVADANIARSEREMGEISKPGSLPLSDYEKKRGF